MGRLLIRDVGRHVHSYADMSRVLLLRYLILHMALSLLNIAVPLLKTATLSPTT